jgi:hypothetical protein
LNNLADKVLGWRYDDLPAHEMMRMCFRSMYRSTP